MARRGASLDELFDRPYRPGAAFGPRISPLRRWGMGGVLLLLVGVIFTYWYLTDSRRVRGMAEDYLSKLTGGHVEVRNATLSIFEGLRLDGVSVRVDDENRADSLIFRAETFLIKYNPQSILNGRLEATQIVALDPQVRLCEDLDKGKWNWQRTSREETTTTRAAPAPRMKLPEILLRNAQIQYSRIRNGELLHDRGQMEIEGTFRPGTEEGALLFTVQSRGEADAIGPVVTGTYNMDTRVVAASLQNFRFGKDMEVMLPQQVRTWWVQHGLSGSVDIPRFYVKPGSGKEKSRFRIETDLRNVTLDIQPDEWLSRDENRRLTAMRESIAFMKAAGLDAGGFVSELESMFNPSAIELDKVAGRFVFTEDGIEVDRLSGWIEQNPFYIDGKIEGYSPQAAVTLTVDGRNVTIPANPRWVNSVPPEFREVYDHLKPEGNGAVWLSIRRPEAGAKPVVKGRVDIHDGKFVFDEFPYPLRNVRGTITFGWDEKSGMDRVDVNMRGMGTAAGPNKHVPVDVRGFVGPLGRGEPEFDFWVQTRGVTSEPALTNAYPAPVREALKIFDAPGKGEFPKYFGGFVANVHRPPGPKQKWGVTVDVDLEDAEGSLTFFPYPVDGLTGKLHITESRVDVIGATVRKGDAELVVDGHVTFGKDQPLEPHMRVTARNLPIDAQLLGALPKDRREWLQKVGASGKVDLDGVVRRDPAAVASGRTGEDAIGYDMNVTLNGGAFWPVDGAPAISGVTATMQLSPHRLVVTDVRARRGKGRITGNAVVNFGASPSVTLNGAARDLLLDRSLYNLLPATWREGWDAAQPEGTVDVDVRYTGRRVATTQAATRPATPATTQPLAQATTRPTTQPVDDFEATIRPVQLAMTPRVVPVRLEDVKGAIVIRPEQITLREITAKRKGGGTVAYSGTVPVGGKAGTWELTLAAKDVTNDKELRAALPPAIGKLLDSLRVEGKLGVELSKLNYRAVPGSEDGDVDVAGVIALDGNALDVGVPLGDVHGTVRLDAAARRGKLAALAGAIDFSSLTMGGREVKNFKAELLKPDAQDALRIGKIAGEVAGGNVAGDVDLAFPDTGPSRFGVGLLLRNADVAALVGNGNGDKDKDKDIKGRLTASLAVEGNWGDPGSRRGRGDVQVTGKDMYKIPLVLGLMQITNLALPISSPFNDAAARYTVEGERISFEQIELRASNMLMSGSGWLDFASKKVKLTFVTDNPNAWRIPFISDLLQGARQEFLKIHVSGSVQEPKVRGSMMSTFTTTVDEVFNGNKQGDGKGKR